MQVAGQTSDGVGCSFSSRYNNSDNIVQGSLVDFAKEKLLLSSEDEIRRDYNMEKRIMAAFGSRVDLELNPYGDVQEIRKFEASLIEGHMRVVYSVPSHERMYSGYPSEPVLAQAASQVTLQDQDGPDKIADAISILVDKGLAATDDRGELLARVLLLQAANNAAEEASRWRSFKHSDPIPLENFFVELFGKGFVDRLYASTPQNVREHKTFREYFDKACIRLTHYGKADLSAVTSVAVPAMMARACGLSCCIDRRVVDVVIPVVLDREAKLDEPVMSAIFVKIKEPETSHEQWRIKSDLNRVVDERDVDFFPRTDKSRRSDRELFGGPRPYVSIVMELDAPITQSESQTVLGEEPAMGTGGSGIDSLHQMGKQDGAAYEIMEGLVNVPSCTPPIGEPGADAEQSHGHPTEDTPIRTDDTSSSKIRQSNLKTNPKQLHPCFALFARGCSSKVYPLIGKRDSYAKLLPFYAAGRADDWRDIKELRPPNFSDEGEFVRCITWQDGKDGKGEL